MSVRLSNASNASATSDDALLHGATAAISLDNEPTPAEIRRALTTLYETALAGRSADGSGASSGVAGALGAPLWQALKDSAEAYQLVEQVVLAFWRSEEMPDEWEARLLTHLPREPAVGGSGGAAGELHTQGKYRGIRMLELCYKIVANVLIERSSSASS